MTTPVNLAHTYLAPPNTPEGTLKVLQKAFEQAVKDPQFVAQAKKLNIPIQWRSPEETKTLTLQVLNTPPDGVEVLKGILGMK